MLARRRALACYRRALSLAIAALAMSIQLSQKASIRLRFAVGDRVECSNGHGEWVAGRVAALFHTDDSLGLGMCVPYLVITDDDKRIFAPMDDDNAIRATAELEVIETAVDEEAVRDFSAAEHFEGLRVGYIFQMGPSGLGYYADTTAPSPTAREDCAVELIGLISQEDLNGKRARTLQWSEKKKRMGVKLEDGTCIAVKLANLRFADDDCAASCAAAFESAT